jgi:hypothetical protein
MVMYNRFTTTHARDYARKVFTAQLEVPVHSNMNVAVVIVIVHWVVVPLLPFLWDSILWEEQIIREVLFKNVKKVFIVLTEKNFHVEVALMEMKTDYIILLSLCLNLRTIFRVLVIYLLIIHSRLVYDTNITLST